MSVSSVNFGSDSNIYYTSNLQKGGSVGVYMYKQPLSFSYTATYEGLKKAVDFINNYKERMNVESLSASFDSLTGQLMGTISLNLFSVVGGNEKYEEPETGITDIGTENIFGTYTPNDNNSEDNPEE